MRWLLFLFSLPSLAQTAGSAMPWVKPQFFATGNIPAAGYRVCFWQAGTTTPQTTFTTSSLVTPNTNPVVLDSSGRASIFFSANSYKVALLTPTSTTSDCITGAISFVWTQDNIANNADLLKALLVGPTGAAQVGFRQRGSSFTQTVQTKLEQELNLLDFGCAANGSTDDSACITAAMSQAISLGGGVVNVPNGKTVAFSTSQTIVSSVILDVNSGQMKWIGSSSPSVAALTMTGNYAQIRNGGLTTGVAGADGIQIRAATDATVRNFYISGASGTTGFNRSIHVTGDGSVRSFRTHLSNIDLTSSPGVNLQIDHAIDTFVTDLFSATTANSVLANNIIIDKGTSGVYAKGVSALYGIHGLWMECSATCGAAGSYDQAPLDIVCSECFFDTTTGGDAILADSTLSTNALRFRCTDCWASAAGLNSSLAVVTAAANGITWAGGTGFTYSGWVRFNSSNGVAVTSANAQFGDFHDSWITANNQNSNADAHGVYISAAAQNVGITNNHIGNIFDTGGGQKYAIKVAAVAANELRIEGNDLNSNVTGALSNGSTGNTYVIGNLPSSSPVQNVIWGDTLMVNGGKFGGIGDDVIQDKFSTFGAGCTTAASIGATCNSTYSWSAGAFADTNYKVSCTISSVAAGIPVVSSINRTSTTQVIVTFAALTAVAAQAGNVDCLAWR